MNYVEDRIKRNIRSANKSIAKDVAIIAGGACAASVGVFGTVVFTKQLIDFYNSGEALTFQSRMLAEWNEGKIGFSLIPTMVGGVILYNKISSLKDNVQYRKRLKENLRNFKSK